MYVYVCSSKPSRKKQFIKYSNKITKWMLYNGQFKAVKHYGTKWVIKRVWRNLIVTCICCNEKYKLNLKLTYVTSIMLMCILV